MSRRALLLPLGAAALLTAACPSGPPPEAPPAATAAATHDWKPAEGCPPVAVPDGAFDLLGDPRACKGGRIVLETNSYPTHMNYYGPERDYSLVEDYTEAMFNTLVSVHPNSLQIVPELAATWEEPERGRVFVFHLDPDAKWSDGKPVVAQDVVATFELMMHPKVGEVLLKTEMEVFATPEALDEHTVRFTAKEPTWRNILKFDEFYILPAHHLDPATYLDAWHWKPPVVSGQYELGEWTDGQYFTFVRRKDFWGEGKRQFIGIGNFDTIHRKVIFDNDIAWETFKKGDIDYYLVTKAQRWAEETDFDKVQKGWIKKQKMFMRRPEVPAQWAFNLTDPLFTDVRVRKAMFWLLNREYLHEEIFYNQYVSKQSYFANSIYENPDNEKITFNPEKGLALLAEAGWTQKDGDGVLIKDGKRFEFDLIYIHPPAERSYTPLQESFRQYGIKMNLVLIQPSAWIKASQEKAFRMIYANWGPTPFPNVRTMWHSSLADQPDSNNIGHYKNPEVDRLIEQYEAEFDLDKRAVILQQVDAILWRDTPYMLDWYAEFFRNMWWDKFGMPEWCSYATMDIRHTNWRTWWAVPARAEALDAAMKAGTSLPLAPPENTAWKRQR